MAETGRLAPPTGNETPEELALRAKVGVPTEDAKKADMGKRFLWLPMKFGIPVAIIGAAAIGYGIYRLVKHYKKKGA